MRADGVNRAVCLAAVAAALALALIASSASARNAYISQSAGVSVLDTQTNQIVAGPIAAEGPYAVAITPDGSRAFVANYSLGTVSAINTETNQVIGAPIPVGNDPLAIAISPDGRFAYVANSFSNDISVIDTQTDQPSGPPISVGTDPNAIAITPDGRFAYVAYGLEYVSVIDLASRQLVGSPIVVGKVPDAIAITPDGSRAYVSNSGVLGDESETVSVIDTQTNQVIGSPIAVGEIPRGIAITPDGRRAYVAVEGTDSVAVIDTATDVLLGSPVAVGGAPVAVAITPGAETAYVATELSQNVAALSLPADRVEPAIATPGYPQSLAITPDQPPTASFSAQPTAGLGAAFNAAASSDPDGSVARYDWSYGDGSGAANAGPTPAHLYRAPGTYDVTLTVTDNEGCSTRLIFTGQTAYCNGSALASQTRAVRVAAPAPPAATLRLGKLKRNKRRGTALLTVSVSGPGRLTLSGKWLFKTKAASSGAGNVRLLVRAKGKARRALRDQGKTRVRARVTFLSQGGATITEEKALVLRKRLQH